ncbi:MAG: BTAD domain-containing putative transcriptional regulator [bacterium]
MTGIELRLLGGASLHVAGTPAQGRAVHRHRLALLARLALAAPAGVPRDKLIALLWPDRDTPAARQLLRSALHDVRSELGPNAIATTGPDVSIDGRLFTVDVSLFEERLKTGDLDGAVALYRGPFLDGFFLDGSEAFEEWATFERTRLAREYERALERLATDAESRGDSVAAARWWRALATARPSDGRIALRLIESNISLGDPAGAFAHAVAHARWLRDEHGVAPDAELTTRVAALRRALSKPADAEWFAEEGVVEVAQVDGTPRATPELPFIAASAPVQPVSDAAPPKAKQANRRHRSRTLFAFGVAALSLLGTTSVVRNQFTLFGDATTPAHATVIAVAPFTIVGGAPPELRLGLPSLLTANLDQVADIHVVPAAMVASQSTANSTEIAGVKLLQSLNAELRVTGVIVPSNDGITISARLIDPAGAVRARVDVRGPARDLSKLVDKISLALLREIWGRRWGVPEPRLTAIATTSPAALRAFVRGEAFVRAALWDSAASALAQAVDLDSTFALANLRLAEPYGWRYGMSSEPSQRALAAAMRFADRLPPRERMLLTVRRLHEQGDMAALDSAAALAHRYPTDPEALYVLADVRFHVMDASGVEMITRAIAGFDSAMTVDSMSSRVFAHPLSLALDVGDSARFDRSARRLVALDAGSHVQVAKGWDYALLRRLRFASQDQATLVFADRLRTAPPPFWQLSDLTQSLERTVLEAEHPQPELLMATHNAVRRVYGGEPSQAAEVEARRTLLLVGLGRMSEARASMARRWESDPNGTPALVLTPVVLGYAPPGWLDGAEAQVASSPYWRQSPIHRRRGAYWRGMLALGAGDLSRAKTAFLEAGRPAPAGDAKDTVDRGLAGALRAASGWIRVMEGDSIAGFRDVDAGLRQVGYEGNGLLLTRPTRVWWARTMARVPARRAEGIDRMRGELVRNEGYRLAWWNLELAQALAASGDRAGADAARRRFDALWTGADARAKAASLTMELGKDRRQ